MIVLSLFSFILGKFDSQSKTIFVPKNKISYFVFVISSRKQCLLKYFCVFFSKNGIFL